MLEKEYIHLHLILSALTNADEEKSRKIGLQAKAYLDKMIVKYGRLPEILSILSNFVETDIERSMLRKEAYELSVQNLDSATFCELLAEDLSEYDESGSADCFSNIKQWGKFVGLFPINLLDFDDDQLKSISDLCK